MKKRLFLLSVLFVMINSTLVEAVAGRLSTPLAINEKCSYSKLKLSEESFALSMSEVHARDTESNVDAKNQSNVQDVIIDLWNDSTLIELYSSEALYDSAADVLTFTASTAPVELFLTGIDESGNRLWYSKKGATYTFSGELSSDGYAKVYPCILYGSSSHNYDLDILDGDMFILDEGNDYSTEFEISVTNEATDDKLINLGFVVMECSEEAIITSKNHRFDCEYRTLIAQKWSEDTDLPGLGLKDMNSDNKYVVLCEDGVTTLGLRIYNNRLFVTGINTTANELTLPCNITIGEVVMPIYSFGEKGYPLYINMDWSAAKDLIELDVNYTSNIDVDYTGSSVTDLYIGSGCYIESGDGKSDIYLHIPYGSNRSDYNGFKRVLVGDEQLEYPVPAYASWVIAGENEGDYFGISKYDGYYSISEIFTEKDSVVLPSTTPAAGGQYLIRGLGLEQRNARGTLCEYAQELKSVVVPETYNRVAVYWSENPVLDLHMQGNVPTTYWGLPSYVNVYTARDYYVNYKRNSSWDDANILPDGWNFELMTVNVGRKGEFAQTYIEMTDADWSLGLYVKVTGLLDETDLNNIKNLTDLVILDLSEADFARLPSSFMYDEPFLEEVVLPEHLTSISDRAFYNCGRLKKVTAPGVRRIGTEAFRSCGKLVDFDISNIEEISSYAFYNCSVFNPVTFPDSISTLGSYAFRGTAITEVTIPSSINKIEAYVFADCDNLQKVTLPNSITLIGDYAFYDCTNLVEINLQEGITTINRGAFTNCSRITEITLPSTLQTLGYDVFDGCTSLLTVKSKAVVPPATNGEFTYNIDFDHCTLYVAPFAIDAYRAADDWNRFYIMKPLDEPVKNIYINRPVTFDLLSEDNAVLQENPNMVLDYYDDYWYGGHVGQLSASGDGTLSAGIFSVYHQAYRRTQSSSDIRTTLVNNAENMRADSVVCSIVFEKNYWHFISFQYDVEMDDVFGLDNTDFVIRKYNSVNRASGDGTVSNWEQLSAGDVLEAGKGYIIQVANNSYDENGYTNAARVCFPSRNTVTKNRLFTSNNVIVPLEEYPAEFAHNRSWNFVGNPYPCYYDMHYLMDDFMTPVVLWRGTSYQAYSPVDDDIILRPNEAFFVQRPLDKDRMVFGAEGRMHYDAAYNSDVTPGSKASRLRSEKMNSNRSVFNFNVEGCGSDDRARIVMNEDASMEYEINCDANKFFAEVSEGVEVYVNGDVKYDICERPFADGTAVLGTRIAKSGKYTITLTGRSIEGWSVTLEDTLTGETVDLTENPYLFDAEAGTVQARFVLTFKAPGQTGVENVVSSAANTDVRVVNVTGVTVYEGDLDLFKANAKAGVYVVVDSEKTYKIVIK